MKHLFKPEWMKNFLTLLLILLVVKLLWVIVELLWLPTVDIDARQKQDSTALYYRVKLTPSEASAPKKVVKKAPAQGNIRDLTLLAIYHDSEITIVTVKYKNKTHVLETGEEINGFKLVGGGSTAAHFTKGGDSYVLEILKHAKGASSGSYIRTSATKVSEVTASQPEGEVRDVGDYKIIDRSLFDHYTDNMDDIYKNIGITEVKNGEDIQGFKVTFVRKNSPFAQLGIQRNDVIKSINGQLITSYAQALEVYKNIQDAANLTVVVIRGKKEMELEYEIN